MQVENPDERSENKPEERPEAEPVEQLEESAAMGKRQVGDQRDVGYRAYLLRCWKEGESWRYSVETAGEERKPQGFGSLESLLAWLGEELIF